MGGDGQQWVAVAAIVVQDGKLLALRRSAGRIGAGLWETVSGRVHPGEEPLSALEREIVEETGLAVRVSARPVDAYAAQRGSEPMVVLIYRADFVAGEVRRSEEHDAHAWLEVDAFAQRTTLARLALAARRAFASSDPGWREGDPG